MSTQFRGRKRTRAPRTAGGTGDDDRPDSDNGVLARQQAAPLLIPPVPPTRALSGLKRG